MATKRQSLGKGLDALLGLAEEINADQGLAEGDHGVAAGNLKQIPVEFL
tara:strand:+ start:552 stop:698 length:147 start_codon:yes stop_codon:yes gene_type:complete